MSLLHLYRAPGLSDAARGALLQVARVRVSPDIQAIDTEYCFNIAAADQLTAGEFRTLSWLLSETFEPQRFGGLSFLDPRDGVLLEVGPRMNFSTAWSTNAVSICHACGLSKILRIERSRRYLLKGVSKLGDEEAWGFLSVVHDRMTETPYQEPLRSFESGVRPEPVTCSSTGSAATRPT
jgi:phosphoribosylformylglycinamidine synthase